MTKADFLAGKPFKFGYGEYDSDAVEHSDCIFRKYGYGEYNWVS